jgi:hypothetical protein
MEGHFTRYEPTFRSHSPPLSLNLLIFNLFSFSKTIHVWFRKLMCLLVLFSFFCFCFHFSFISHIQECQLVFIIYSSY